MAYHSDEIPIDIVLSLTGLLPMHCAYSNSDTKKNCPFLIQSQNSDFQQPCIFKRYVSCIKQRKRKRG